MRIEIKCPDKPEMISQTNLAFSMFLQAMMNRIYVGNLRYGEPNRRKLYLSRMKKELKVYEKTGNFEQLINIANYCFLESVAPENRKFYFDPSVASVTRE